MGRTSAIKPVGKAIFSYASTNVTTSAWVEIISSIPHSASAFEIFDSSGRILKLSVGTAGNEDASELSFYITPSGTCGLIPIEFSKAQRLSAKAIDASATVGYMVINFYG